MSDNNNGSTDSAVFEMILKETQAKTGVDYFRAIVRNLAESLNAWGCWVTEYYPETDHMVALAFWTEGDFLQHYEYDVAGTACEAAVQTGRLYHVGDNLIDMFPESDAVVNARAVSYIGSPILDENKRVIGLLGIMDTKPLINKVELSLFEVFVERAQAELNRMRLQHAIERREAQMQLLLTSTMDGILLLNKELEIVRTNPAAIKMFDQEVEQLQGTCLLSHLTDESVSTVRSLAEELLNGNTLQPNLFIQDAIKARRGEDQEFPIEASISIFDIQGEPHFGFILRDVNEALESGKRIHQLTRESEALRASIRDLVGDSEIIGECSLMRNLASHIERVAKTHSSVLILGETGVGKEMVSRAIHQHSPRSGGPLVCVNCAALPEELIESELFGHEKGAFTGANTKREGRFAQADGGTLFLDEIGELPLSAQAKLLRVLQEGEFEALGSSVTQKADVRVIAATHRNLDKMVSEGKFREDLFFRLNVFPLTVPPLRERGDDITLLAEAIVTRLASKMGKRIEKLDATSIDLLNRHNWPGNVRELQNTLERALIVSEGNRLNLAGVLPSTNGQAQNAEATLTEDEDRILTIDEFRALERDNIVRALELAGGRVSGENGAASLLQMKPTTLSSRIQALGI